VVREKARKTSVVWCGTGIDIRGLGLQLGPHFLDILINFISIYFYFLKKGRKTVVCVCVISACDVTGTSREKRTVR